MVPRCQVSRAQLLFSLASAVLARVGGTFLELCCVPAFGGTGILRMICRFNWEVMHRFLAAEHRVNLNVGAMGDREKFCFWIERK